MWRRFAAPSIREEDGKRIIVAIALPLGEMPVPLAGAVGSIGDLSSRLPTGCIVIPEDELSKGSRREPLRPMEEPMAMWERLHTPFLAAADADKDLVARIEAYRMTIRVDYACELAHQRLSDVARDLARQSLTRAKTD